MEQSWKDALARAVFKWQVYGLEQPDRAEGWKFAVEQVVQFFAHDGKVNYPSWGAGSSLSLAADVSGPVSKMWTWVGSRFVGPTVPDFVGMEHPFGLLKRLETTLRKNTTSRFHGLPRGFHSPYYASILAADEIHTIMQKYTCSHPSWSRVYSYSRDEPPEDGYQCLKCKMYNDGVEPDWVVVQKDEEEEISTASSKNVNAKKVVY